MTQPPSNDVSQHSTTGVHWETVYQTKALTEVSWFEASADTSLRLIGPRPGPTGTGRAVDVGAGTSPLTDGLVEAGWGHVTALDVSATALDVIRQRIGDDSRVSYVVSDILAWEPRGHYDLWHDRAVCTSSPNPPTGPPTSHSPPARSHPEARWSWAGSRPTDRPTAPGSLSRAGPPNSWPPSSVTRSPSSTPRPSRITRPPGASRRSPGFGCAAEVRAPTRWPLPGPGSDGE